MSYKLKLTKTTGEKIRIINLSGNTESIQDLGDLTDFNLDVVDEGTTNKHFTEAKDLLIRQKALVQSMMRL